MGTAERSGALRRLQMLTSAATATLLIRVNARKRAFTFVSGKTGRERHGLNTLKHKHFM
jgi:hypothetical protein